MLFTDIVASTQHAAATGDERWRAVLHRIGEITTELTERFGGTVVKSTGDGYLATFEGPTQAIRCAEALRADAETLAIEIRAGIDTGECELMGNDIGESRYTSRRGSSGMQGRVTSSCLAPCVTWSSVRARASRTAAASSCVACPAPGNSWRSIAMARERDRLRRELVSIPTPGSRTAMRRSDRAVEVMARRAPWILRGVGRLASANESRQQSP